MQPSRPTAAEKFAIAGGNPKGSPGASPARARILRFRHSSRRLFFLQLLFLFVFKHLLPLFWISKRLRRETLHYPRPETKQCVDAPGAHWTLTDSNTRRVRACGLIKSHINLAIMLHLGGTLLWPFAHRMAQQSWV